MQQTRGVAGFYSTEPMLIYQHRDAGPDKLGINILGELRELNIADQVSYFEEMVCDLTGLDEDEAVHPGSLTEALRRHFPDEKFNRKARTNYELFEPFQGTLKPWLENRIQNYPDGTDFIDESYFCKWGYILNLSNGQFEILRGDQTEEPTEPLYNRFGKDSGNEYPEINSYGDGNTVYYPCRIVKSYNLKQLPSEEQFLKDLEKFS